MAKSKLQIEIEARTTEANKQIVSLSKNIKNVGNATEATTKKVGFFRRSVDKLSDSMKVLSTVGLIGIVTGLINAGKSLFNFNKELDKTRKSVSDLTGKSGEELDSFTAKIQATADTFEQDFNEVLLSANTVANEFGISVESALEKINQGFINGSNASGQFLDILKEYSPQLKAVGLSADQAFRIINQQVKEGVFSDKGVDAIKEAGLRLREMPEATKKALDAIGLSSEGIQKGLADGTTSIFNVIQKVSNKLGELPPQSVEVGTAIADIFGGAGEDAGLRYLKTLKDINLETSTQNKELTDAQKLQNQQLENQERINDLMSQFFGESNTGFSKMIADLKTISLDLIVGIINGVKNTIKYFEDLSDKSKGFRLMVSLIGGSFKLLWSQVKSTLRLIGDGFTSLGGIIEGVFTLDTDKIKESFKGFGAALKKEVIITYKEINKQREDAEKEFNTSNEEKIKQRALERREAQIQEATETARVINEIQTNALQIQNNKNNEQVRKASQQSLNIKRSASKQETEMLKNAQEEQKANTLANSLANVDITKNAGSQMLNVFRSESVGALIKSIIAGVPFPLNILVAGGAGAIVNSLFSSLPKFEDGGIVGGNSFTGDNVTVRVNSDEMILNRRQQAELFRLANGSSGGGSNSAINNLANKIDDLTNEIVFQEKNININNEWTATPEDVLNVTDQGQRDKDRRSIDA